MADHRDHDLGHADDLVTTTATAMITAAGVLWRSDIPAKRVGNEHRLEWVGQCPLPDGRRAAMTDAPVGPYVARFGLGFKTVLLLLFAAVAVAAAIALDPGREMPTALFLWLWKLLLLGLFGGGGLVLLVAGLSRRVALRVDREGITLGSPPRVFPWLGRSVLVRWDDIRAVAVFHQYAR